MGVNQTFRSGRLIQEADSDTGRVRRFNAVGAVIEDRALTADELAAMNPPEWPNATDSAQAAQMLASLRSTRADLRAALRALPNPAARNAAQRRDALLLRASALLIQSTLASWGTMTAADREETET